MRRHLCGIIGVGSLIGWVALLLFGTNGTSQAFSGGCLKAGLIFTALWLAYPQIEKTIDRTPKWFFYALVGGLCAIAIRRELLIVVVPVIIIFLILEGWKWLLAPPKKRAKSTVNRKR